MIIICQVYCLNISISLWVYVYYPHFVSSRIQVLCKDANIARPVEWNSKQTLACPHGAYHLVGKKIKIQSRKSCDIKGEVGAQSMS